MRATEAQQLVTRLFRDVVAGPGQSTVRVLAAGKEAALGVVVSADGWILSKHSELKGKKITCKLPDGEELEAELVGFDVPNDLAMLKVDATDLKPVEWSDSKVSRSAAGSLPSARARTPRPSACSASEARAVKGTRFANLSGAAGGYLGLALDFDFAGVKVQEVLKDTPAHRAGLKSEDRILSVNGEEVQNVDEFQGLISNANPAMRST